MAVPPLMPASASSALTRQVDHPCKRALLELQQGHPRLQLAVCSNRSDSVVLDAGQRLQHPDPPLQVSKPCNEALLDLQQAHLRLQLVVERRRQGRCRLRR